MFSLLKQFNRDDNSFRSSNEFCWSEKPLSESSFNQFYMVKLGNMLLGQQPRDWAAASFLEEKDIFCWQIKLIHNGGHFNQVAMITISIAYWQII